MHFSSSVTSAVGDRVAEVEEDNDMCAACVGIRYWAYDHSESKYLTNWPSGDKEDCRLLRHPIESAKPILR